MKLAKNDFKTRYAGSYFGTFWAFVQPVVTILVYWFVFSVGFRSNTDELGVPFVLYLVAGIVPWFFFSDALSGGTNSLLEYNYLVKKVVFNISVLPVVKIISALFVHGFFVLLAIILYICNGRFPDWYYLQILYYSACVFFLVLGLCYATSAIAVLFRDLNQIIGIGLQVGVWLTPIMWVSESMIGTNSLLYKILQLNPVFYIVSGYRDAFIIKRWFFERPVWTFISGYLPSAASCLETGFLSGFGFILQMFCKKEKSSYDSKCIQRRGKVTVHETCSMKYRTVEELSSYDADRKERKQRGK